MVEKIKTLFVKYREQIMYLIVGFATTAINYIVYFLFVDILDIHYITANIIAWIIAVSFAYFANGRWVYNSTTNRSVGEAGAFIVSRLFSLGMETLILFLMVDLAHINELVSKIIVAVVIVILNYLTGLLVFKRKNS
ncbi:MAG: GtrA family protein [Clostridiales bacterium]|nr:GtrA family protein [Clostridiales bacterium]